MQQNVFSKKKKKNLMRVKSFPLHPSHHCPGTLCDLSVSTLKFHWYDIPASINKEAKILKYLCHSPQVMDSVLDVEKPLVQGQIRDIDVHLKKAEESLKWNSEGQLSLKYKSSPPSIKNI